MTRLQATVIALALCAAPDGQGGSLGIRSHRARRGDTDGRCQASSVRDGVPLQGLDMGSAAGRRQRHARGRLQRA